MGRQLGRATRLHPGLTRGQGRKLGWGSRIRTDSVEGRIWADSEQPRRNPPQFCGHFKVCMSILTLSLSLSLF